jgi:hypothetical protein
MAYKNLVNATSDRWLCHVDKVYSDFAKAATTSDPILIARMPSRNLLRNIRTRHRISFTGGAVSACTVSLGTVALPELYASRFDIFQAASETTFELVSQLASESACCWTNVYATLYTTGANTNALTAGQIHFVIECLIL